MRDGMPRAYLRIDPNIDHSHPDNLEGFIRLMCAAARQPERGRFRSRVVLEGLLGKAKVRALYARGDVCDQPDGRVYVLGWDEWQEGDHTVGDRMARLRARRRNNAVTSASPSSNPVTTDAVLTSSTSLGVDDDVPPNPPPSGGLRAEGKNPRAKAQAAADLAKLEEKARQWRRNQRQLAYLRNAITDRQLADMNQADTPLEQIPGYSEHVATLA